MTNNLSLPQSKKQNTYRNQSIEVRSDFSCNFLGTSTLDLSKYVKKKDQNTSNIWLNHLEDKPLLQVMVDNLPQEFMPVDPTQLNCYERLKKMLASQSGTSFGEKQPQEHRKILDNVAIFEDQITKLQTKYRQKAGQKGSKVNFKYLRSQVASCNPSIHDSGQITPSLISTQKSIMRRSNTFKKKQFKSPENKSVHHATMKDMINEVKNACCQKFLNHKKKLKEKDMEEFEEKFQTKIEKKIEELLGWKFKKLSIAQEQNSKIKNILLERDLQVEGLKKQMKTMEDRILAAESQQEPERQVFILRKNIQQFFDQYKNIFGEITLQDLRKKMDFMQQTFFQRYSVKESKHLQYCQSIRKEKEISQKNLKERIEYLEKSNYELSNIITKIRNFENLDNSDQKHQIHRKIPQYKAKCQELETLRKFIFGKYIDWKENKKQSDIKLLNLVHSNTIQNYQLMIEAMLEFNKNHGTPEKNIEYFTKILSMIQKLKKVIAPSKCYEKLSPLKVLEEVETVLIGMKRRRGKKMRTMVRLKEDEDFFMSQQINFS